MADALPDYFGKERGIAGYVAQTRSLDHFFGSCFSPINVVASLQAQFTNKLALGSAVALAKWMRRIQLTEIIRRLLGKRIDTETSQVVCRLQLSEDLLQR